ncbi:hypothetical protein H8E88_03225 [candidate division KSB1 bacterium]|nr:hypothetical protein [candidate division KSB1 bacterium]
MVKLSEKQIKEIADLLDAGLKCYLNKRTYEIKEIIDFDSHPDADPKNWQEIIDELDEHFEDYIEFNRMPSNKAFRVMEDFIDEVDDEKFKKRLYWILSKGHPFRNFKDEIDYNGDYREKWFAFKLQKYIEWVEDQINDYNREIEEEADSEVVKEE